jgi:hypothetical protein
MIAIVDRQKKAATRRENSMHDLLIALAFIGMVIAPAVVAANSSIDGE